MVSAEELTYIFCGLYKEFVEDHNGQSLGGILAAIGLVISLYYILIYLKLSNISNSSIIDEDCFAA